MKNLIIGLSILSQSIIAQEFTLQTIAEPNTSIRAIQIEKNSLWFVGSQSEIGNINLENNELKTWKVPQENQQFRSLATTNNHLFFANTSSPATIYSFNTSTKKIEIALTDHHPKAFYDAIFFKNNKNGIAFGDPYDKCPTLQLTKNGGATWTKIDCNSLPKLEEGEAAFAASNTNIVWVKNKIAIATGGQKSRILLSENNGKNWNIFETPFIQGGDANGMYSIDFIKSGFGIAVGGNYKQQNNNTNNIAISKNFGKSWEIVANEKNTGYKTCVAIKPFSNGKIILAVGDQGISLSEDFGKTWREISNEKNLYIAKWYDQHTIYLAGNKKIAKLTWNPKYKN